MAKQHQESVPPSEVRAELTPANYKLVDIDPDAKSLHIPLLKREYTVKELAARPDVLELLHRLGWPNVEKS